MSRDQTRWTRARRAAVFAVLLLLSSLLWPSLPAPLFDAPLSTLLTARDGTLLGARIAADGQWRFPPLTEVSPRFAAAAVAFEDRRFYRHPGVDPLALARAFFDNRDAGRIVSGGSTLTMQVVRLARGNPPRTYGEKAREALLALRVELSHTKPELLALWASHAPFGGNVVGLEAAAWRYFGRAPAHLSWAEAATLAVLPNAPALVHPGRSRAALQRKRDALLRRLAARGELSSLDLDLALREPLPEAPKPLPQLAPHLLETLHAREPARHRFVSTLDLPLQRAVTELVARHSATQGRAGIHNAAALVLDNDTFSVQAYVGNSAFAVAGDHGHAVDVITRPRSTGSLLKPFLYAAMLQQGELAPTTLVPDLPTQYGGYMPENYDREFRGAVPAWLALARSLNVPAVRMLHHHGVGRFYDFLRQAGMTTLHRSPDGYGLSLVLGGAEGTLWELTALYANLAAIAGSGSGELRHRIPTAQADRPAALGGRAEIGPGAAWLTLEALVEVARPGIDGFWRTFGGGRRVAWKTGTSYGFRDGWAIGVTPRHTVGVWAGNASGEGRPELTGVTAAAPLLFDIVDRLEEGGWFARPEWDLREVTLCRDDGYLPDGQCATETRLLPRGAHFADVTPNHRRVHLDASGSWRVHSRCEPVANMRHADWFVLPPGQEFYYRRRHADYRALPPLRSDCAAAGDAADRTPLELLYPLPGTRLYIPVDLGGSRSRAVFRAVHRESGATLFWHLDEDYLGATESFHEVAVDVGAGVHRLAVVDGRGNRVETRFEVFGESE